MAKKSMNSRATVKRKKIVARFALSAAALMAAFRSRPSPMERLKVHRKIQACCPQQRSGRQTGCVTAAGHCKPPWLLLTAIRLWPQTQVAEMAHKGPAARRHQNPAGETHSLATNSS